MTARHRVGRTAGMALALLVGACVSPPPAPDARAAYLDAIKDAAVPEPEEAAVSLVRIAGDFPGLVWRDRDGRREILVVAWMSRSAYERFYAAGTGRTPAAKPVVWVTAVPQVREACRRFAGPGLETRLKQHLGLAPEWRYDRFVELWVDPADLFRPCPDPDPADDRCNIGLPMDEARVPRLADYRAFFAELYVRSYRADGAPWTRLGYTYDWAPGSGEVGASEFMLAPDSAYTVAGSTATSEYCRP